MLSIFPPATATASPAPLRWKRAFPGGDTGQAGAVRRFVACLLADRPCVDDVVLAADELVVNALRHTRSGRFGGSFSVEVVSASPGVTLAVMDQGGPGEPAPRDPSDTDQSGRGLRIVSATATAWGWHGNEHGRTVTAFFAAARM